MFKIGLNKLTNFSVEKPEVSSLFEGEPKASILYSDPPWGEGNMKFWTALMAKQTGCARPEAIHFSTLLERVIQLAIMHSSGMVFIENGVQWENQVAETMERGGLHGVEISRTLYSDGPMCFVSGAIRGTTHSGYKPPYGMKGAALPAHCVQHHAVKGGIVFDPCCGMGYTAKAAHKAGMRFFGNELNPARLRKTVNFLKSKNE
jgi:hypothetical protein